MSPDFFLLLLLTQGLRAAPAEKKKDCTHAKCPWRLWSHYEEKGCKPVYDSAASCCPSRFDCPPIRMNDTGCLYKDKLFAEGSDIEHSNDCKACRCQSGEYSYTGKPRIDCAQIECPEMIWNQPDPSCLVLYRENQCCTSEIVCPPSKRFDEAAVPVCHWANRSYPAGTRIYFEDDECSSCLCGPNFKGPNGPGCKRFDYCYLEKREELEDGCIPVYNQYSCCPMDWICPKQKVAAPLPPGTDSKNGCTFDGRHYPLGASLDNDQTCATTCTCTTPPEFTCEERC